MRDRATALAVAAALALAGAACTGGREKNVVNQYFTALRANDTNTLTSFALVQFDQAVQDWKVVSIGPETKTPAALPGLVQKQKELEAEQKKNERDYRAWGNDLAVYPKLQQVIAAEGKGGAVPPALKPIQEKYQGFNQKNKELKKAVTDARLAVEKEKRNVTLSVGQVENVETLNGDMLSKDVELQLTINGERKPYLMALHKYELAGDAGPRTISRWVVQSLTPKG